MKVKFNPDGTIKELPWQLTLTNAFLNCAKPILWVAAVQWAINSWRASKDGKFHMPHTVKVFNFLVGLSCVNIAQDVWAFGIPTQCLHLSFALWPDGRGIGLQYSFWVPATQSRMADDILRQNTNYYAVEGRRIGTGATFTRPWGVQASVRSFDQWMLTALHNVIGDKPKFTTQKGKAFTQKLDTKKGKRK